MRPEMHWLEAGSAVSAEDLCHVCRITMRELQEIVSYGVPQPSGPQDAWSFSADWLLPLRQAARMGREFDLDLFAVSVLAGHLHRIDELERELRELRARIRP